MPIVQAILETIEADMTKAQIVGISQVLKCFKHPKDPKGKSFLNDRPSFQYKRNDQLLFNWHQLSAVRRLIRYRLTPLQSVTIRDTYPLIPHDSNVSPWFALCPAKERPGNTSHRVTPPAGHKWQCLHAEPFEQPVGFQNLGHFGHFGFSGRPRHGTSRNKLLFERPQIEIFRNFEGKG